MKQYDLLEGSVTKHLFRLALPSVAGMFSMTIFNLTDTYFVSQLGTDALAAMGYTLPIVMLVGALTSGISMGAASLLSRAKGADNTHRMQRIATDSILLSVLFVVLISLAGLATMNPVFKALGAEGEVMSLLKEYMIIWYASSLFVITAPVTDSVMRACGDMTRPFIVMIICAVFNIVLDPLLIHGYWIFPKWGIAGAAMATVIARALGMAASLYFAHNHHRLISFKFDSKNELWSSWRDILTIGLPSTTVQLMPQLLRTIFTALVSAAAGSAAIAAIAIGQRLETFLTMAIYGIGAALIPLAGINWGAKKYDRVYETRRLAIIFSIVYCGAMFVISIFVAKPVSAIFTDDAEVIKYSAYYLWIMILGLVGMTITNWMSQLFTTIGRPRWTVIINVVGTLAVLIPLSYLGRALYGYIGILLAIAIGQTLIGIVSVMLANKYMHADEHLAA